MLLDSHDHQERFRHERNNEITKLDAVSLLKAEPKSSRDRILHFKNISFTLIFIDPVAVVVFVVIS
jgi:hypothetical protein